MLDAVGGFATLVWPASGLALAALLGRGLRLVARRDASGRWSPISGWARRWERRLGIAGGNTLEAVLAAYAAAKAAACGGRASTAWVQVVGLVMAALLSTLVAAAIGVGSLRRGRRALGGPRAARRFAPGGSVTRSGDLAGGPPLLLAWMQDRRRACAGSLSSSRPASSRRARWGAALTGMGLLIFSGRLSAEQRLRSGLPLVSAGGVGRPCASTCEARPDLRCDLDRGGLGSRVRGKGRSRARAWG